MSTPGGKPHVPAPSLWPIGFAVGLVCLLVGFVISWWGVVIGAALAVVFGFLWVYDLTRGMREPAHAPAPGTATVEVADEPAPAHEDEIPTYSRSVFLELSTIGVGGIIGGLVTLPALGFAVIPAFEHHKQKDVDLGPLSNFPEGQYVVTTFLEDPAQGEVTRKTAFIRNNGLTADPATKKQVPSFTIIYSRCAHLGCPVQPGAVLDNGGAKTFTTKNDEEVRLIKTEGLTGFGCPCHGGQYDAEGNRTAGPPVRSLDRFAYSVVDDHLILGTLYSVGHVEGAGATAKIRRYTSASPGVHVNGWERWLYPIPVPGR
jgi:menaquinol-cytochrome c reductase iron-sulfur subunit